MHRAFDQDLVLSTIEAARTGMNPGLPAEYLAKVGENLTYIQSTRPSRRLFVGNLPSHLDLNEFVIAQFFKAYMLHCGFQTPEPILTVSLAESLTYAFVEFRGVEDATAVCYMMNGVMMGGRRLRVARPKDYRSPAIDVAQFVVQYSPGQYRPPPVKCLGEIDPLAEVPVTNFVGDDVDLTEKNMVILRNVLKVDELKSDLEWLDIVDDMLEEAYLSLRDPPFPSSLPVSEIFTTRVRRIIIPRPCPPEYTTREIDANKGTYCPPGNEYSHVAAFLAHGPSNMPEEVGNVFILFAETQAAEKFCTRIHNRLYNTTRIKAELVEYQQFVDRFTY